MDLGYCIGINGIIFSPKDAPVPGWKLELEEAIKQCPLNKVLIETDCPYLIPPQEFGLRNEPVFVKHVAQRIAELKEVSFGEVVNQTAQTAKTLFGI